MSTSEERQRLRHEVATGRGLWVGLFPDNTPAEYLREWWPGDAHITLTHLGRGAKNLSAVDLICDAAEATRTRFQEPTALAEVTGFGVFWRRVPTLVALINSPDVLHIRNTLINELLLRGVIVDAKFGFIPHVTLLPKGTIYDFLETPTRGGKKMHAASPFSLKFSCLTVVCGDVRISV